MRSILPCNLLYRTGMISYQNTKKGFLEDVKNGTLVEKIRQAVSRNLKVTRAIDSSEYRSWEHSISGAMSHILEDTRIPDNAGIAVEYGIMESENRADIIITGVDRTGNPILIIIELKQWSKIHVAPHTDAMVIIGEKDEKNHEAHPSYQVISSYAAPLQFFSKAVEEKNVTVLACVYLHNHVDNNSATHEHYDAYTKNAPVFCHGDKKQLQTYIASHIVGGDNENILHLIDHSGKKPSKDIGDILETMIQDNPELFLVGTQKHVFEEAKYLIGKSTPSNKHVYIVTGGPGTGKSIIALKLLVHAISHAKNASYITKNAAPRIFFEDLLAQSKKSTLFTKTLFTHPGSKKLGHHDVLIVDEAHRLTINKLFGIGNEIDHIIQKADCVIFFIDENQRVRWEDIGTVEEVKKWANTHKATTREKTLISQFRCSESREFIEWLPRVLQMGDGEISPFKNTDYTCQVVDSATALDNVIISHNRTALSRLVAGYCWPWKSKEKEKNGVMDIVIGDFQKQWNFHDYKKYGESRIWLSSSFSINQVGCIHTIQGLEADYIGVIIGPDLKVRNNKIYTYPEARAKKENGTWDDYSLIGYKAASKRNPEETMKKVDRLIKNTYYTLMSRGKKGCYLFSEDEETREYFRSRIQ